MVINLTFANETAFRQGLVQNHQVDPDLTLLSDHHALMFMISDPRETVSNLTEAKYNWKDAMEIDFVEALKQELHKDENHCIMQVLNRDHTHATLEELDNTVRMINNCME